MDDFDSTLQTNAALADTLLGQPKDVALARIATAGAVVRLVDWDQIGDGSVLLHSDLREERITVHIKHGVVTEASAG